MLISPPSYLVDSYLGRDAAQAETELAAPPARWNVSVETTRRDGTVAGQVIDQVPPAGTRLRRGGALVLTKSDGEELRRVPSGVVNVPIADATAVVTAAGLSVGATEAAPSETVPAGIVLAVKGGEGELAKGTAVVLVVSGGPQRRTLPSFAGQSPDAAKTKLTDVGLTYEIAEQYSESVAKGLVLSTEPAAGEQLDRGGSVVIVVSLGRKAITIPDLANRSPADAATALQDLGLVPEQDGLANRPVIATDPPAGDRVYRGDKVRVISRRN